MFYIKLEARITTNFSPDAIKAKLDSIQVPYHDFTTGPGGEKERLLIIVFDDIEKNRSRYLDLMFFLRDAYLGRSEEERQRDIEFKNRFGTLPSGYTELFYAHFSERERMAAAYLIINPSFHCFDPVNIETLTKITCLHHAQEEGPKVHHGHLVQVEPFVTSKKQINWKPKRCIGGSHLSHQAIFCNDRAKAVIEKNKLNGAEFRPILQKKDRMPLQDAWQLWPQEVPDVLVAGAGMQERRCESCGKRVFLAEKSNQLSELLLNRDRLPEDLDFFQSEPVVGVGLWFRVPIISQRAYRVLKEADMLQAVTFTPILTQEGETFGGSSLYSRARSIVEQAPHIPTEE